MRLSTYLCGKVRHSILCSRRYRTGEVLNDGANLIKDKAADCCQAGAYTPCHFSST